jgi:hypothetical protein
LFAFAALAGLLAAFLVAVALVLEVMLARS